MIRQKLENCQVVPSAGTNGEWSVVRVTRVSDGVWSVHSLGQRPVEGVAVWRYANGLWRCERHGYGCCGHVAVVRKGARP
jgi:hypothetical protein